MKYWLITYGCQMNKSDSERITTVLEKIGYKPASKITEADLVLINMCSVRQSAVDRVYGKIKDFTKLKAQNLKLKTVLTGCILKKDEKKFEKSFDYIFNIKNLQKWLKTLNYYSSKTHDREFKRTKIYFEIEAKYSNNFSTLVPIMTGCNNFCAYCVVPYVRGREVSRPAKEIVCEVKNLVKRGYKEIWLLGQNVNSYKGFSKQNKLTPKNDGRRNWKSRVKSDFPQLLKEINNISGKFWIRFTSSHPKDFSDELIEIMANYEKVTEYLNLPVQAGDDEILKKMNRPYTVAKYKKLVKEIRKKIPNISLSTDVIVGFPGETKKQFENTAKLFKEIKYDMAYIAKYSPRAGTTAAKLKDNVSQKEKGRREKVLTEILKETALENNRKYVGKTETILPSEYKDGFLIGKSFHYKTVKFKGKKNLIGKFVKVKITDALPWGLKGKILK